MVCSCGKYGLGYLPIVLLVNTGGCFITTYLIAAYSGHVSFEFPYISDTGSDPPESCIFTFFLSIGAFLAAAIIFIRYRHVADYNREDVNKVLRINKAAFYIGMVSPLGMLLVASFQNVNVLSVHILGAGGAFFGGCIYAWLQTLITYRMHASTSLMLDARFLLSLFSSVSLIIAATYAEIALLELHGKFNSNEALHWNTKNGGFRSHIASTIGEWCTGLAFLLFFLTYVKDFSRLTLDVQLRLHLEDPLLLSSDAHLRDSTSPTLNNPDEHEPLLHNSTSSGRNSANYLSNHKSNYI